VLLANYPVSRAQLDAPLDLCRPQGRKRGRGVEETRGRISRGTTIELESRLRIGRAIAKTEEEVAFQLMTQLKERAHPQRPPALATDGKGSEREAMVETWGQVPAYAGRGRPPTRHPAWCRLALSASRQRARLSPTHRGAYAGGLWGSARGEGSSWRAYGLCGTHTSDLTPDECTLGT
jgi:hypothetical protein